MSKPNPPPTPKPAPVRIAYRLERGRGMEQGGFTKLVRVTYQGERVLKEEDATPLDVPWITSAKADDLLQESVHQ